MPDEKVHIQTGRSDKVLCGLPANMWITAMLDAPVEDFCPQCLAEALSLLTLRALDGATGTVEDRALQILNDCIEKLQSIPTPRQ